MSGQLLEPRHQQKAQGRDYRNLKVAQATASLDQHTKLGLLDSRLLDLHRQRLAPRLR
jgi:hypothetical protein